MEIEVAIRFVDFRVRILGAAGSGKASGSQISIFGETMHGGEEIVASLEHGQARYDYALRYGG